MPTSDKATAAPKITERIPPSRIGVTGQEGGAALFRGYFVRLKKCFVQRGVMWVQFPISPRARDAFPGGQRTAMAGSDDSTLNRLTICRPVFSLRLEIHDQGDRSADGHCGGADPAGHLLPRRHRLPAVRSGAVGRGPLCLRI